MPKLQKRVATTRLREVVRKPGDSAADEGDAASTFQHEMAELAILRGTFPWFGCFAVAVTAVATIAAARAVCAFIFIVVVTLLLLLLLLLMLFCLWLLCRLRLCIHILSLILISVFKQKSSIILPTIISPQLILILA